jgi:putative hydrolase of the HAD superfamily
LVLATLRRLHHGDPCGGIRHWPDPRIYALICTRLNVPAEEMVFLDDSDVCVAGARDAGLHAVRYQDNPQAIAEIEKVLASP